jgi:hypothetical protein
MVFNSPCCHLSPIGIRIPPIGAVHRPLHPLCPVWAHLAVLLELVAAWDPHGGTIRRLGRRLLASSLHPDRDVGSWHVRGCLDVRIAGSFPGS